MLPECQGGRGVGPLLHEGDMAKSTRGHWSQASLKPGRDNPMRLQEDTPR